MGLRDVVRLAEGSHRISLPLSSWLAAGNEALISDPVLAEKVIRLITTNGEPQDRSGAWHPSSFGQCPRRMAYAYLGEEPLREFNPTLRMIFADGTWRHLRWQVILMEAGIVTDIEVPVRHPELRISGSMDGENAEEGWGLEIKGTRMFDRATAGVFPEHVRQLHGYLLARPDIDRFLVIYEDKTSQRWVEHEVQRDDNLIEELTALLEELNAHVDNGTLPEPLDACHSHTAPWPSCPYRAICPAPSPDVAARRGSARA